MQIVGYQQTDDLLRYAANPIDKGRAGTYIQPGAFSRLARVESLAGRLQVGEGA